MFDLTLTTRSESDNSRRQHGLQELLGTSRRTEGGDGIVSEDREEQDSVAVVFFLLGGHQLPNKHTQTYSY